ncbi:MAG TPA: hypothetical protein PKD68_02445, partial [Candidatus Saccharibacteria bacterium]|nr:hypothetical protein [Candidatus Saccharibacteria bacterium]
MDAVLNTPHEVDVLNVVACKVPRPTKPLLCENVAVEDTASPTPVLREALGRVAHAPEANHVRHFDHRFDTHVSDTHHVERPGTVRHLQRARHGVAAL